MRPSDPRTIPAFQSFLRTRGLVFACAESCTGGLLSRQMTARAGASEVFWGGVVSYDNGAKIHLLRVPEPLLDRHGAVSGQAAVAMVRGLLAVSQVPLAASITGVAGPSGGTEAKPVGTVWFGVGARKEGRSGEAAVHLRLSGTRDQIQHQAATWARRLAACWWDSDMELDSLRSLINNNTSSSPEDAQPSVLLYPHPL